jgi:acetyl esterase/lipase
MTRVGVHYGPHHAQVAELWRPAGPQLERPVVVLLHGGFWRQIYTKRLMHRLAAAVVAHGWVAYNVEYRRVGQFGRGGWPETFQDVSAAIDSLVDVEGIDHQRVVTCGHSAGGHLALWAGSSRGTGEPTADGPAVRVHAAISLAGVVDLVAAAQLHLGRGAVQELMGGGPEELPDRYALGSPAALLPLGIRQILIHGRTDTTVPASLSATYVEAAIAQGDNAEYVPVAGAGHMDMIDPHGPAVGELLTRLDQIASTSSG